MPSIPAGANFQVGMEPDKLAFCSMVWDPEGVGASNNYGKPLVVYRISIGPANSEGAYFVVLSIEVLLR